MSTTTYLVYITAVRLLCPKSRPLLVLTQILTQEVELPLLRRPWNTSISAPTGLSALVSPRARPHVRRVHRCPPAHRDTTHPDSAGRHLTFGALCSVHTRRRGNVLIADGTRSRPRELRRRHAYTDSSFGDFRERQHGGTHAHELF